MLQELPLWALGPDLRPRPHPTCAWHHPWISLLLTPQSLMKAHNLLFIPQNPACISLLLPLWRECLPTHFSCAAPRTRAPSSSCVGGAANVPGPAARPELLAGCTGLTRPLTSCSVQSRRSVCLRSCPVLPAPHSPHRVPHLA